MNILFVTEFFPNDKSPVFLGGVQARTYFVAKNIENRHKIRVLSLSKGKIEATTLSLFSRLMFALRIITFRPEEKPDVIEATNVATYIPAYFLARRLGVPRVAWIPDVIGRKWFRNFSLPVAAVGFIAEKLGIRLPWNKIIAMSNTTKEKLIKSGVNPSQIEVVYGGVEVKKLSLLKVKKLKKSTVISISRLLPYKRLQDLVKAAEILKKKGKGIKFIIIGEGPEKKKLQDQIKDLGLSGHVRLLDIVPHAETMKMLKQSHVFCLPSTVEGFGIVTLEAMACGVPYVNSKIPPTVEITKGGRGGLLFEPQNPQDLADKIISLFEDQNLYQKKKDEGIKLAKDFDWSIIAKQTEAIFKKATRMNI